MQISGVYLFLSDGQNNHHFSPIYRRPSPGTMTFDEGKLVLVLDKPIYIFAMVINILRDESEQNRILNKYALIHAPQEIDNWGTLFSFPIYLIALILKKKWKRQ